MNNIQPKTLFIGKNSIYLPTCHSTNDIAAEMIQKQAIFDGTIVITSHQTAGRGQRGNSWETSADENITVSIILKPTFLNANKQFKLNIAISLGIHEFLNKYISSEKLTIKWSNDIYFGNKKLGGILIENTLLGNQIGHSIIGIGLNINQLSFNDVNLNRATSLREITENALPYALEKLVAELCEYIEKYYLQLKMGNDTKQQALYLRKLFRYQELHYFINSITKERFLGQIIGIDEIGKLALAVNNQIQYFDFKEIIYEF